MRQPTPQAEAERLVSTYSDLILRLCYTYLKNTYDAEDICQEVLLKLLSGNYAFASPEHEKAWIITTASNACKDLLKCAGRSRVCTLESCAEQSAPAMPESHVLDAVQALPEHYREVIYLYYYEGYDLKEIGKLLSIPAATAGTRLSRGREKLKTMLGGTTYEQCV